MGFSVTFLKWWFLHDSCFSKTGGLGGCFSRSLPGLMCFMGIQRIKFWLYHYTSFCTLVKERFHYSFFSHGEVQLFSLYIISKDQKFPFEVPLIMSSWSCFEGLAYTCISEVLWVLSILNWIVRPINETGRKNEQHHEQMISSRKFVHYPCEQKFLHPMN